MKDQKYKTEKQSLRPEIKPLLQSLLAKTIETFHNEKYINEVYSFISQLIKHSLEYREEKGLIFSTTSDGKQYISELWDYFFSHDIPQHKQQVPKQVEQNDFIEQLSYPLRSINQIILQAALYRQNSIWDEIRDNRLKIQIKPKYKDIEKSGIDQGIKHRQQKQLNQSKATTNSQKDFLQFVKNQKLQKQKRKKLLQVQHQKQLQRQKKRQQQQKKLRQAQQAKIRQQKRLKQQQILQKRQKQKQQVKKHQSLYNEFQDKIYHAPQKIQPMTLFQRYESQQLKKMKSQKQKLYKSYERPLIDQHQKSYIDSVQKRTQQRYKRMQQIKQIEGLQNERSRIRFRSSFKFQKPQQEYERKKKQDFLQAKQKRDRVLSYKEKVKSDFVPLVDQHKKQQLMKMMEELQLSRKGHYKKKVLENGQVVMEKIEIKGSKQVGLNYLQSVKQQVSKMRAMKKQNGDTFFQSAPQQDQQSANKPIDYLKQMRQSKSKSTVSGFSSARKTAFANTKSSEMSFEQKLKKIQDISTKLMQKTKQQEMLLKYGKFKTSEEILNKKQIIDRNYIDLVNLKLQMIQKEEGGFGIY